MKSLSNLLVVRQFHSPPYFVCIVRPSGDRGSYYNINMDIHVQDCDSCLNPFWADELVDNLCTDCQIDKAYSGNPNWAGDD